MGIGAGADESSPSTTVDNAASAAAADNWSTAVRPEPRFDATNAVPASSLAPFKVN